MNIIQKKSPNFWKGRQEYRPEAIVIHIMDGTFVGTDSWFANPNSQVSAHYGIGKNGEVHQYVEETDTAWHAGRIDAPVWKLIKPSVNPNLYTIGIEHEGKPDDVWTSEMKQASSTLIKEICQRWLIPIDRDHVIGHYEIYAKKPNCPSSDKRILDELVSLARLLGEPSVRDDVKLITPMKQYSFLKGLFKSSIAVIVFAVPLVLADNPAWANLTIGGLLMLLVNYLKVKYLSK